MRINTRIRELLLLITICGCVVILAYRLHAGERPEVQSRQSSTGAAQFMGSISDERIRECSGMDISLLTHDFFWMVNDSGNGPYLYALGMDGRTMGRLKVNEAKNRDWEGLDTFLWRGQPMILIGDIGDNKARYDIHTLYIVKEPRLSGEKFSDTASVDIAFRIIFSYPDGNHDAESIAVDATLGKIFFITKRDSPPCLYELPLKPSVKGQTVVAKKVMAIRVIPPPAKKDLLNKYGLFRSLPTALDISADGLKAVILTYKDAYMFTRTPSGSWPEVFSKKPQTIPLPGYHERKDFQQREAICFSQDGKTIYVTSEGKGAGIFSKEVEK